MQYAHSCRNSAGTQRVVLRSRAKNPTRRSVSFAPESGAAVHRVARETGGAGDADACAADESARLSALAERNVAAVLKLAGTRRSQVNTNSLFSVDCLGNGDGSRDRSSAGFTRQKLPSTRPQLRRDGRLASHARLVSASCANVNSLSSSSRPGCASALSGKRRQLVSRSHRSVPSAAGGRGTVPSASARGKGMVASTASSVRGTVPSVAGNGRGTVPSVVSGRGTAPSAASSVRGKVSVSVSGDTRGSTSDTASYRDASGCHSRTLRSRSFLSELNDAFTSGAIGGTSARAGFGDKSPCSADRAVSLSHGLDCDSGGSSADQEEREEVDLLMGELTSRGEQLRSRLDSMLRRQYASSTRYTTSPRPPFPASAQRQQVRRSVVSDHSSSAMQDQQEQSNRCSVRPSSSLSTGGSSSAVNLSSNATLARSRYAKHIAPVSLLRHVSCLCLSIDTLTFMRDFVSSTLSAPGSSSMTVYLEYRLQLNTAASPSQGSKAVRVGGQPMSSEMVVQYDCVLPVKLSSPASVRHWLSAHLQLVAVAASRLPPSSSSSCLSRRRLWTLAAGSLPLKRLLSSGRLHLSCLVPLKLRSASRNEAVVGHAAVRLRLGGESAAFSTALHQWSRSDAMAEDQSSSEDERSVEDGMSCASEDGVERLQEDQSRAVNFTADCFDNVDKQLWFSVSVGRGISSVSTDDEEGPDPLSGTYVLVGAPWLLAQARSQTFWSQHSPDYHLSITERVDMTCTSPGRLCGRGKLLVLEVWRPSPFPPVAAVEAGEVVSGRRLDERLVGVGQLSLKHVEEQLSRHLNSPHLQHTNEVASWSDLCRINDPRSGRCVARIITTLNVTRRAPHTSQSGALQLSKPVVMEESSPKGVCRFRLKLSLGRLLHVPEVNEAEAGAVDCYIRYLWPQQAENGDLTVRVRWCESPAVVGRANPPLCHTAVFMYRTPPASDPDGGGGELGWLGHVISDACAVSAGVRCQAVVRRFHPRQRQTIVAEGVISVSRLVSVLDALRADGSQSAVRTFCVPLYLLQERSDPARPVLEVTLTADRLPSPASSRDQVIPRPQSHLLLPFSGVTAGDSRGNTEVYTGVGQRSGSSSVPGSVPILGPRCSQGGLAAETAVRDSQEQRSGTESGSHGSVPARTQQQSVSWVRTMGVTSGRQTSPVHDGEYVGIEDSVSEDDELSVIGSDCDGVGDVQRYLSTEPRREERSPSPAVTCNGRAGLAAPLSPLPEEITLSSASASASNFGDNIAAADPTSNDTGDTQVSTEPNHDQSDARETNNKNNSDHQPTGAELSSHSALLRRIERDLEQFCSSGSIALSLANTQMTDSVAVVRSRPTDVATDALSGIRDTDLLSSSGPRSANAFSRRQATSDGRPDTDVSRLTRESYPDPDVSRLTRESQLDPGVNRLTRDVSATFRAQLSVLEALHLPRLLSRGQGTGAGDCRSSNVPLVSVSVDTERGVVETGSCRSLDPRWNWSETVHLATQLLQQECPVLVLKVWHRSSCAAHVLGLVFIDLAPLLHGLDELLGWYNITDLCGLSRGQVKLSLRPLDELRTFKQDGRMCPSLLLETVKPPEKEERRGKHVLTNSGPLPACAADSIAAVLRHTHLHRPEPIIHRSVSLGDSLDSPLIIPVSAAGQGSTISPEAVCLDGTINTLTHLLHRNLADLDGMRVSLVNRSACNVQSAALPVVSSLLPLSSYSSSAPVNGGVYSSLMPAPQTCSTPAHQPLVEAGRGVPEGGNPEALACVSSPSSRKQDPARNSDISGVC